jgi:hypothetical protein
MGSALGAALTNRPHVGAAESGLLAKVSAFMLVFALDRCRVAARRRVAARPSLGVVGIAWIVKAIALRRQATKATRRSGSGASDVGPVTRPRSGPRWRGRA